MRQYCFVAWLLLCAAGWAQPASSSGSSAPSLTIYNQNFAVVRELVPLQLNAGVNQVSFDGITSFVEPSSVVLRDPSGRVHLSILEQNYRTDVASQYNLLHLYEGKEIDFQYGSEGQIVRGKIIRAGMTCNNNGCYAGGSEPIIEVNGKIEFGLPGKPIFPAMQNEALLNPALNWLLQSDHSAQVNAEISYITGGLTWEASYNVIAPVTGDVLDMVGWISLQNHSGHTFENARIQLMAGAVNKIAPSMVYADKASGGNDLSYVASTAGAVATEKAFDEYHLYTLERPSTVENGENKQVEFLSGTGIPSKRIYVYEGYMLPEYLRSNWEYQFQQPNVGMTSNQQVSIMREFRNSAADHLGIPLPKGRMRFYRRDTDGSLQFIGENVIPHTPRDETLRVYTGDAFDITAERFRTDFHVESGQRYIDETYQIKLRNHKKEAVQVQVVEHMYRCDNWTITAKSLGYVKKDRHTVEFTAKIAPDAEQVVTYSVHYTW
ncbi:MAG TPA: DUF4139 domain-containing protein [Terriglobales bacterium]